MFGKTLLGFKDRMEFAKAVNFGDYPVISIDASEKDDTGRCAEYAIPVRVEMKHMDGSLHNYNCEFCVFADTYHGDGKAHCTVMNFGTCISASFYYEDAMNLVKYANTPILKANEWAVVIIHNSKTNKLRAFKVKMGNVLNNCQTAITFADESDSATIARTILAIA